MIGLSKMHKLYQITLFFKAFRKRGFYYFSMKVCIIAIARQENLYINEWINYHLNLGFDNIIVCDNNDTDERVSDILNDEKVTILDYVNIENVQSKAYTECFLKYRDKYDWLMFIDVDEFVVLDQKYHNNIKEFLSDSLFKDVDIIRVCWKIYTSNTDLDVVNDNYNVFNRFKDLYISGEENFCKSIIRGNIEYIGGCVTGHGYHENRELKVVATNGVECKNTWSKIGVDPIYDNAWINHYPTKTIGEFIRQKYFRGGPNADCRRYSRLNYFFKYNIRRPEIEEYAVPLIKELAPVMVKEKYAKFYPILA